MNPFCYKGIISLIMFMTLSFPLGVFAIDIQVSARVPGCGDEIIEPGAGEQCEQTDLGGQSCTTLGFQSGELGCTSACTFDVSFCSNVVIPPSSGGGGSNSGSRVRDNILIPPIPNTNVVFSGTAVPGTWVIILNNGTYFTSTKVPVSGLFITTVSGFETNQYNFIFYGLSVEKGLSHPEKFSIELQQSVTTKISNIVLTNYPEVQEEFLQQKPLAEESKNILSDNKAILISEDGTLKFLEGLSEIKDISSQELIDTINNFAEQEGYRQRINTHNSLSLNNFLAFLKQEITHNFAPHEKVARFYPNVYISFMTPYWVIAAKILHYIR